MKRVIFGALAACFAFSAFAQSTYSQIVEQQQRCSMYGEMWQEVKTSNTIGGKPLKYYSQEHRAGRIEEPVFMEMYMIFLRARSDSLRTPQDAYMKGWAECMDGKQRLTGNFTAAQAAQKIVNGIAEATGKFAAVQAVQKKMSDGNSEEELFSAGQAELKELLVSITSWGAKSCFDGFGTIPSYSKQEEI